MDAAKQAADDTKGAFVSSSQHECDLIMQLDVFVIIEYIKSAIDIILNLKFDEIEQRLNGISDS